MSRSSLDECEANSPKHQQQQKKLNRGTPLKWFPMLPEIPPPMFKLLKDKTNFTTRPKWREHHHGLQQNEACYEGRSTARREFPEVERPRGRMPKGSSPPKVGLSLKPGNEYQTKLQTSTPLHRKSWVLESVAFWYVSQRWLVPW